MSHEKCYLEMVRFTGFVFLDHEIYLSLKINDFSRVSTFCSKFKLHTQNLILQDYKGDKTFQKTTKKGGGVGNFP